ncbi:ATP-grasp domain-containing protein [Candidimonas sp. SYP-B2681]|uniref:ATP-grasp domain-containing protein n=1 Tax=Candidimonas sp. SYP-B2681 TaxID=2497686 RepID=UPI000F882E68|nr:ATP-grasp domain-containing protein [Candidimonas sp. SYP-B2681]RTZ42417.1 ATP-grasp domain-containing protein [Candidimonas sp. SYP-B2681]
MKIFICDHSGVTLPDGSNASSSAGFRGDIMMRALLADISQIESLEVLTLQQPTSPPHSAPRQELHISVGQQASLQTVDECMLEADAVWPLAAESNGLLELIATKAIQHNRKLFGSTRDAVHLAASKYRTSQALQANGVPVVPTYRAQSKLPTDSSAWVVKPDDGAGCSDTHIFPHRAGALKWIGGQGQSDYVLQPYVPGRPCSLSLLCSDGDVLLMGCNDHRVAVSDNQFQYMGSIINSIQDSNGQLQHMARCVLAAMPGMWGYVGIDFIITDRGPVVLEVNPRMTLSHVGLHASTGTNPVQVLLDVLSSTYRSAPSRRKIRQISVDIKACQEAWGPDDSVRE